MREGTIAPWTPNRSLPWGMAETAGFIGTGPLPLDTNDSRPACDCGYGLLHAEHSIGAPSLVPEHIPDGCLLHEHSLAIARLVAAGWMNVRFVVQ